MRSLIAILAILSLGYMFSCSGQYHARKALKKGIQIVKTDTVVRIDTVWRTVESVDTVFKYEFDTVIYYQDSVLIKYFYRTQDSLVYIEVDCPDCPEITKETEINNIVLVAEKKGFFPRLWIWLKGNLILMLVIFALIGGIFIFNFFKR